MLRPMSTAGLTRVLEPEVMDTEEEARDYDAMDHREVNLRFCDDLLAEGPIGASVLDVGTGTAQIPIELCRREPTTKIVAIDLAEHMLALGAENVDRAGLTSRVALAKVDAKRTPYASGSFTATISNSIIHHIPEPRDVLSEMLRVTAAGGLIFVRDLCRPSSKREIDRLVELYAGRPPTDPAGIPSFERQRELFRASLGAALTPDEVLELARDAGLAGCHVRMTSDRHWTLVLRK